MLFCCGAWVSCWQILLQKSVALRCEACFTARKATLQQGLTNDWAATTGTRGSCFIRYTFFRFVLRITECARSFPARPVVDAAELAPQYSHLGRPSIDPVLMIRMLAVVGYVFAIRSKRLLYREVQVNLAYRWFCGLGIGGRNSGPFSVLACPQRALPRQRYVVELGGFSHFSSRRTAC